MKKLNKFEIVLYYVKRLNVATKFFIETDGLGTYGVE